MVFATMDGLMAFRKDVVEKKAWNAENSARVCFRLTSRFSSTKVGNLKVYACGMVMDKRELLPRL